MKYIIYFLFICSLTGLSATEIEKVVILGSGAAGSAAAIFTAQSDLHPLVIQDAECKAQMALIHKIDNYPGVLEEIEGIDLLKRFREQAVSYGARFVRDSVVKVDLTHRPFTIELASGNTVLAESVIIATGTVKRWLDLPNETSLRGKGVIPATFCQSHDFNDKKVVVIGGGHAALQEAHYLSEFAKEVVLVNRSDKFNASKFHQEQVFNNEKIQLFYNTEVDDILDPSNGKVTGIVLKDKDTNELNVISTDLILVAIGNKPNTEMFKGQLDLTDGGNIRVKNTSTNIPGVYAAGDVTDAAYGRVVISAGSGATAALEAIRFLSEQNR